MGATIESGAVATLVLVSLVLMIRSTTISVVVGSRNLTTPYVTRSSVSALDFVISCNVVVGPVVLVSQVVLTVSLVKTVFITIGPILNLGFSDTLENVSITIGFIL